MSVKKLVSSRSRYKELESIVKIYPFRRKYLSFTNQNLKSNKKIIRKINKIERACNVLAEPYKTIIKNTFFEKRELYWWARYYPKTTYYRLRDKAISSFLLAYELQ